MLAILALERVDDLLVLAGAERGDAQRLGLAAREQGRAMRARQQSDLAIDRPHRLGVAAVDAPAGLQDVGANDVAFEILELLRHKVGGEALITADHGNVEQMEDESTGQAHTAHTCEPVPFVYVGKRKLSIREGGVLADVAPTMLTLMGLEQPAEMTGRSIVTLG